LQGYPVAKDHEFFAKDQLPGQKINCRGKRPFPGGKEQFPRRKTFAGLLQSFLFFCTLAPEISPK
jgi:hypothetical protein